MCLPVDMSNQQAMGKCMQISQEADCQKPDCKWGNVGDIIADASNICVPNDLTDDAAKEKCSAFKKEDLCVAPCAFVSMKDFKGLTDINTVKCRPQLDKMSLIDANINCGSIASETACSVNKDCRWATAIGDLPDPTKPDVPPVMNCLPKNLVDMSN
jgi:hypothetical protein